MPVDDDERNSLNMRLNAAFTAGTLDEQEYRRRLDLLFAAGTLGELVPVVEGLPPRTTYQQPAVVDQTATGRPGELSPARATGAKLSVVVTGVVVLAVLLAAVLLALLLP